MNSDIINRNSTEDFKKEIEKKGNGTNDIPFKYSDLFVPFSNFIKRETLIKKLRKENSKERIEKYSKEFKGILIRELF